MKHVVRIIGGQYRGKKLSVPEIDGLRPTPDRVRETLFNWLMHDIRGARCLDAFAGSGALAFEAFSRGAARVILVEQSKQAFKNLTKQADLFSSPNLIVVKDDACQYLAQTKEQFDIVFLDPPFAKNFIPECIELLERQNILEKGGLLYLESPHEIQLPLEKWKQIKSKRSGYVFYSLYQAL